MLDFFKPDKYKMILAIILFVVAPFPLFMNIDDFGSRWSFVPLAVLIDLFFGFEDLSYIFLGYKIDLKLLALFYVVVAYFISCFIVFIYRKWKRLQTLDSRFRGNDSQGI